MTEVISTEKYKIIYSEEPRCKIIYRDSEITVISINGVRIGKYQNSTDADTVDNFHASSIPLPNTLLALNSDSKLPTSITGDADTLDGHHSTDFASFSHNHSKSDITDLETITTTPTAYAIPKAGSDGKLDSDWISGVGGGGDADTVDGFHASSTPQAGKLLALDSGAKLPASITGDADTVDGQHASSFAPASHTHTKSAVTDLETITTTPTASAVPKADSSGKIAAGWLATGSGSGLDADKLDGQHASAFASASHNHDSSYVMLTDYEDADVLAKIKNVDGAGSGLDADLLDGQHAAAFATASHTHSKSAITDLETITATPTAYAIPKAGSDGKLDSGWIPSGGGGGDADTVDGFHASSTPQASKLLALDSNAKLPTSITGDADTVDGQHASAFATASHNHDTAYVKLDDYEDADVLAKIKNVDGSGSGLDADLLDGQHAAAFAAASHTHTKSNITDLETITATPTAYAVPKAGADGKIDSGWIPSGGGGGDADTVDGFHASATPQAGKLLALDSNAKLPASITGDADTVDGQHASAFAAASHNHDSTYVKLSDYDDEDVLAKVKNVDGSGSGLDADLLDGQHASSFAASSHTHTKSAITDLETITTTPTADGVPKADSTGLIDPRWLFYCGVPASWIRRSSGSVYHMASCCTGTALTASSVTASRIYYHPFAVARPVTINRMAINVTTAASGKYARIGIYNNIITTDLRENPGDLLRSLVLSVAATGVVYGDLSSSIDFYPGTLYWAAFISDGTPAVSSITPAQSLSAAGLGASGPGFYNFLYDNGSGYDLPQTASTNLLLSSNLNMPAIFLREYY